MEEKIITEETEEILENNAGSIPEELQKFLEADEKTLSEIENVLGTIDEKITSLNNEREDTLKNFEDRLKEFTDNLEKEKEDALNNLASREQDLEGEKSRIESIKLKEQGNQVNYIDSLKAVSDKFDSKINSISEAIKACEDNDTLNKALEEEQTKKEKVLNEEYDNRKKELDKVLEDIGLKTEPEVTIDPNTEINLDFRTPEEIERDNLEATKKEIYDKPISELLKEDINLSDENEIVSKEKIEDAINEIYQSEEIMEGHVFPYLKSISE